MKFKNAETAGVTIMMLSEKETKKFPFLKPEMLIKVDDMDRTLLDGLYTIEIDGEKLGVEIFIQNRELVNIAKVIVNGQELLIEKHREIRKFDVLRKIAQRLPEFKTV